MSAPQKGNDTTNARMERNATNARIKNNVNQRSAAADPQNPCANILTTN